MVLLLVLLDQNRKQINILLGFFWERRGGLFFKKKKDRTL